MTTTLLAIDIGNTTISLGTLKGEKLLSVREIETGLPLKLQEKKFKDFLKSFKRRNSFPEAIVICSVVPSVTKKIKKFIRQEWNMKPLVIGRDLVVPMKNRYRNPHQVGQDRLVCSFAAKILYEPPLIVIDFGTAITFDVISRKGEYLGGIIVPGIRLTAESLAKKTALLPKVRISLPGELIGRDTKASILSGIFFGFGALCSGLVNLIEKKTKAHYKVVTTGGYSSFMDKFIAAKITCIDQELVFKGLSLLYLISKK